MNPFQLLQNMTDDLLCLAITNDEIIRLLRHSVDPALLPGDYPPRILQTCYAFYDQVRAAPKSHFADEMEYAIQTGIIRDDEIAGVRRYVEQLDLATVDQINVEYILERLHQFVKQRTLSQTAIEFARLVRVGSVDEAEALVRDAFKSGLPDMDVGTRYTSDAALAGRIWRRETEAMFLMPTGIGPLDRRGMFFQRNFYILIMAPEKRGKSWAGVHFGKIALIQGLKVLHLSQGDLTQAQLEDRYDMTFGALGGIHIRDAGWSIESPVLMVFDAEDGAWIAESDRPKNPTRDMDSRYIDKRLIRKKIQPGTLKDQETREKLKMIMEGLRNMGGDLIIKSWPRGTLSIPALDNYLDRLETYEGFRPDVIINDYPDIMAMPKGMEYRHQLDFVHQAHARISHERKCLVIGMSQVKAKSYNKKYITMADFAEDKRKAAHVDFAFALCQTADEEERGELRIVTVVDRHYGLARSAAKLVQDLRIGQFCKQAYHEADLAEGEEKNDAAPESTPGVPSPGGVDQQPTGPPH
jgi:hypothetical protein